MKAWRAPHGPKHNFVRKLKTFLTWPIFDFMKSDFFNSISTPASESSAWARVAVGKDLAELWLEVFLSPQGNANGRRGHLQRIIIPPCLQDPWAHPEEREGKATGGRTRGRRWADGKLRLRRCLRAPTNLLVLLL